MNVNSSSAVHARQKKDLRSLTRSTAFMARYHNHRYNLISRPVIPPDLAFGSDLYGI